MIFCKNCGYASEDDAAVCFHCDTVLDSENTLTDDKLRTLSKRMKINGILWLIIGICQVCTFAFSIVGILNIISAVQDLKGCKNVFEYRVGLVQAYTPIFSWLVALLYNVLFGGVIGIAGSLYYFFGIRSFVLKNRDYFDTLK